MNGNTTIEWTDKTWNPVTGCTKVSQGCKHCYAERVFPRPYPGRKFTDVQCHPERLEQPLRWKKPARIFVNSMSDLFHEDVPDSFIDQVFAVMALASQHTFQVLTKRPRRMYEWMRNERSLHVVLQHWKNDQAGQNIWPLTNVWLGVSVENQETADERIPWLLKTPAAVRFLSIEPLLSPVDLHRIKDPKMSGITFDALSKKGGIALLDGHGIDWVIVGGESGPDARPMHPDWARSIRDQCVAAGVPFFFKQWGNWAPMPRVDEKTWSLTTSIAHPGPKNPETYTWPDGSYSANTGKKAAGRTLDSRVWDELPQRVDRRNA